MKLRSTLLAATAMAMPLAAPMGAHAQSSLVPNINLSGFYVSAGAGANWLLNEDINQLGFPGTKYQFGSSAQAKSNPGPVAVGAIGYLLPYGLAIELEGDYRNNSFAGAANTQFPANVGGHVQTYGPMVNLRFDLSPVLREHGATVPDRALHRRGCRLSVE